MFSVEKHAVPGTSMLAHYCSDGTYTDCYVTEIVGQIPLDQFIFAFYTTFLFKLERLVLKWIVARPSLDTEVRQLANGIIKEFAAWRVENRGEHELLLCDFRGRTRSWLMVEPINTKSEKQTRLYFGSAVVPVRNPKTGKRSLGFSYQALLGFHRMYSFLLLYSAKSKLKSGLAQHPAA